MLNQDPKYNRGIPDLTDMIQEELLEYFKTLEAPTIEEMDGEYHTTKLGYHGIRDYLEWRLTCDNPLMNSEWLGKAFHPTGDGMGRGYNLFRKLGGKLTQVYPMRTVIGPSRYDGKPVYTLVYSAFPFTGTWLVQMVDELRKVGDGTYLLIGTYRGVFKGAKMRPHFWLVEGPYRAYRGDIGRETPKKVDLSKEIPNYKKIMKQAKKAK